MGVASVITRGFLVLPFSRRNQYTRGIGERLAAAACAAAGGRERAATK